MRDIVLEETIYMDFTTRAFATGIPTVLAGTPVLSVLEENNATPITAGVSISVDRASVVGLNMATIVATAANGYEAGKGYSVYVSTGTVGGVSVIGEVVAQFTIDASSAAQDLANGTDGLGAIKADTAAVLVDTAAMQPLVAKIPLSDGSITWNSTALASINAEADTALTDYDGPTRTEATSDKDEIITDLDDIKGTGFVKDTHSLFDIEGYVDILDDGTSGNVKIATDVAATLVDTAQIGTAGAGLTDLGGMSTGMKAEVNAEADTALTDYDGPTNTEMIARTRLDADYFSWATDDVAVVTLCATTTTNTDMVAAPTTLLTTQMTESYATDGTAPTLAQALMLIQQTIGDFAIAGTTITVKKLDGSTTAGTYTLDDGTNPTSRTRTT